MVFVPHCRMANRWFVLEMNLIMRRIVPMWKGLTGCCARLSVCIKTVIYSNLMRNTIVRHWMPAGKLAEDLIVMILLLYHTEDKTLNTRKACYTEEAAQGFSGVVHVPDDLEIIDIIVN